MGDKKQGPAININSGQLANEKTPSNLQAPGVIVQGGFGNGYYGGKLGLTNGGVGNNPAQTGKSGFWGGVSTPNIGGTANYNESTGQGEFGYGGGLIGGSVGYRQVNPDKTNDRGFRVGAGVPINKTLAPFRGRLHYGDADNDGQKEYGFGADLPGWLTKLGFGTSFDYTTESPVQDFGAMAAGAGIGMMLGGPLGALIGGGLGLAGSALWDTLTGAGDKEDDDWIGKVAELAKQQAENQSNSPPPPTPVAPPDAGPCFAAGTPVTMADGSQRAIEDIVEGDLVLAYNEEAREVVAREVMATDVTPPKTVIGLTVEGIGEIIVTPGHRFFSRGSWIAAAELPVDTELFFYDPEIREAMPKRVQGMRTIKTSTVCYNMSVKEFPNYFAHRILVHNANLSRRRDYSERDTAPFSS